MGLSKLRYSATEAQVKKACEYTYFIFYKILIIWPLVIFPLDYMPSPWLYAPPDYMPPWLYASLIICPPWLYASLIICLPDYMPPWLYAPLILCPPDFLPSWLYAPLIICPLDYMPGFKTDYKLVFISPRPITNILWYDRYLPMDCLLTFLGPWYFSHGKRERMSAKCFQIFQQKSLIFIWSSMYSIY